MVVSSRILCVFEFFVVVFYDGRRGHACENLETLYNSQAGANPSTSSSSSEHSNMPAHHCPTWGTETSSFFFLTRRNWTGSNALLQCQNQQENRHHEWSDSDAPHRRADARRAWGRRRTKRARRRAEGRKRARPENEAEETGQVRLNFLPSLDQQGSQANERACPPLKAESRRASPTHRQSACPWSWLNESWSASG